MAKVTQIIHGHKFLLAILILATILRLWRVSEVPVSLFGDELDVGYHAYSIIHTARDYSGNFMPVHFQSLAEWRTPLYIYATVPTVAIFGISPLGVRLPAVIFGVLGIWGMYLLAQEILKIGKFKNSLEIGNWKLEILSTALLAISPWHLQYSRSGFEVTMLLAFLIFGGYFFLRSLREPRFLWISVVFLTFTPWIYSTAKLFTPLLLLFLFIVWKKDVLGLPKTDLYKALIAGVVVGLPITYSSIFGGGAERAQFLSVFAQPSLEYEIGQKRSQDAMVRNEAFPVYTLSLANRFYHNKLGFWLGDISDNYLSAFSSEFLFISGDPNLRHSPEEMGVMYKLEIVTLIFGLIFFFSAHTDRKVKALVAFWLVVGVLPSSLTTDGGNHATRLILILPPLALLISFGLIEGYRRFGSRIGAPLVICYLLVFTLSVAFYLHNYYVHYPWDSQRWWHAGFKEAIQSIKEVQDNYDTVVISMEGEPAWIFFAGWYEYPPDGWQSNYPFNKRYLEGFGEVSYIDKFYFGNPDPEISIYGLGEVIGENTLYLANASELGANLQAEPEKTPPELQLVKAVSYPSGEPAFYLFSGK